MRNHAGSFRSCLSVVLNLAHVPTTAPEHRLSRVGYPQTMPDDSESYLVNVEAAIYADGSYLLVRRAEAEDHAAGRIGLVGGTVEGVPEGSGVLERTVAREAREEVGVAVSDPTYVDSTAFVTDGGDPVVDVVFCCRHASGTPEVREEDEVVDVFWLDPESAIADEDVPPWTTRSIRQAEKRRQSLGW